MDSKSRSGKNSRDIQDNELCALKEILGDDLIKDLQPVIAWNVWRPLNISITVKPQEGSRFQQNEIQLDLHIICSDAYPSKSVKVTLENSFGLSNADLNELESQLTSLASANAQSEKETLYDLYLHARDFLTTKVVSTISAEEPPIKTEVDSQEEKIEDEIDSKTNALQNEVKERINELHELRKRSKSCSNAEVTFEAKVPVTITECELHKGSKIINFESYFGNKTVELGRCIKHSNDNSRTVYMGIDKESGEMVVLNEWCMILRDTKDFYIQRQLTSMEKEMNHLIQMKHDNLSPYITLKHCIENNELKIYILKEFINGTNCKTLLVKNSSLVNLQFMKHLARGIVNGLQHLHRNKLVHKNLKPSTVYVNENGIVRITNYGVHRRISDFVSQSSSSTNYKVYTKEVDIYRLGILLLSVLNGSGVSKDDEIDVPFSTSSEFYDFLQRCLNKKPDERGTAGQLLKHPFLREPIVHFAAKKEETPIKDDVAGLIATSDRILALAEEKTRLANEFEIIQELGKGAFGNVIEVRNKLDGGRYAIKRIKLFPASLSPDKITREVNCLFKLNHENIVRYYNSWVETTIIKGEDSEESSKPSQSPSHKTKRPKCRNDNFNDIEALIPHKDVLDLEVAVTYDSKSQMGVGSSSSDEEDDEEDDEDESDAENDIFEAVDKSSNSIEFERDENEPQSTTVSSTGTGKKTPSSVLFPKEEKRVQCMYIQMELCEKNTLRDAIDNRLYKNEPRVWRLFREIVEGLAHIHQQGVIHRDLKPVNIFLDSYDHVKIGDFGLATTINRQLMASAAIADLTRSLTVDDSKTGAVGTALYVAPELNKRGKVHYNEKVDIYSLGVILFEMSHEPLPTAMERIKVLTDLRSEKIIFPEQFKGSECQQIVIRWLLDHTILKRPTAQELLQSKHLPPPVVEQQKLIELVDHILSEPQAKGYKYLMERCLKQKFTPDQDIVYDTETSTIHQTDVALIYEFVKETVTKIFKKHGAQNLTTPLLMPVSRYHETLDANVKLMVHFGGVVSLPYDLRVPFARYIAWKGITSLRRYAVERVYRQLKIFGIIPRELWECTFDIVTPTVDLKTDGEILCIVNEIIRELLPLKSKTFIIRLNHTLLLQAILIHYGITTSEHHEEVYKTLLSIQEKTVQKSHLQDFLAQLDLTDHATASLTNIFNSEFDIAGIDRQLQLITRKKRGDASSLAKRAIQDLKEIAEYAGYYGVKLNMVVAPGLVYKTQIYSGVIYQFVLEIKKKHKHREVLAFGGRYDSLVSHYRNIIKPSVLEDKLKQSAVGISVSLDKLCQAIQMEADEDISKLSVVDVVVCSIGSKSLLKEKLKILQILWGVGVKCILSEATRLEVILEQCANLKVHHIVILKDNEPNNVRIRSTDKDRILDVNVSELADHIPKILKHWRESSSDGGQVASSLLRLDSRISVSDRYPLVVYEYCVDKSYRKRNDHEKNCPLLDSVIKKISGQVVVIKAGVKADVVRIISGFLQYDSANSENFERSFEIIAEKLEDDCNRRLLRDICDHIYNYTVKSADFTIILYSLIDSFFRIL